MAKKIKALIDLNIILDTLQMREPFFATSARVLAEAETGHIEGWMAPHTVTTLFYLIRKDSSYEQAKITITELLQILLIASVDQQTIERALTMPWRDFEDAVQMAAAIQCNADYLLTRDPKHYPDAPIPVLQPAEFLTLL